MKFGDSNKVLKVFWMKTCFTVYGLLSIVDRPCQIFCDLEVSVENAFSQMVRVAGAVAGKFCVRRTSG